MDDSKRALIRNSFIGALTSVLPVSVMDVLAQTTPPPTTVKGLLDTLNKGNQKPAPIVLVDPNVGNIKVEKQGDVLKAFKDSSPTETSQQPLPDGDYAFGKDGNFVVRNGIVKSSKIDPKAITVRWSEHAEVVIKADKAPDVIKGAQWKNLQKSGAFSISGNK